MKGEELRNAILQYLHDHCTPGVDSISQDLILASLRQKSEVNDGDFVNAIRTLADQKYLLDEASRCRIQPSGIIEVEKWKGETTDHQKSNDEREEQSLAINRYMLITTIISIVVSIISVAATIIISITDFKISIAHLWPQSDKITNAFYTCEEEHCTKENEIRVFNAGVEDVNMTWHYQNILPGSTFAREWKLEEANGKTWVRYECQWPSDKPVTGHVDFVMKEPKGLPAGTWVLTIWVNGERILEERVKIIGTGGEFDIVPGIKTDCFDTIDSRFN